jgi:hypothetical protein
MYSALTDLICVAFVFVLAAFLFAASVAILMTVEALKLLRQMASTAVVVTSRPLAALAKPALHFAMRKNLGGTVQ